MKRSVEPCLRQLSHYSKPTSRHGGLPRSFPARHFHASPRYQVIKPFLLADIGEGIRECQVIQWFVQPGARVEQFDKLCEVQSDKASVEITSRFDGVIKKLYYEADDMAIVGKPLVDIDIQSEISPEDEALTEAPPKESSDKPQETDKSPQLDENLSSQADKSPSTASSPNSPSSSGKHATLATPAVRHLTKELDVDIAAVTGTGKDGRVLKEDVHKFAASRADTAQSSSPSTTQAADRTQPLTPVQAHMFKTMTRSLSIPHFLYTDSVDTTALTALRQRLNARASGPEARLSALSFILKAASLALADYPILNARLDTATDPAKPRLTLRAAHHIGIAIDSPAGLVVPVVRDVHARSVASIAAEIARLAALARRGKLAAADMAGATFSVSNIGSIGGGAVAPVIVEGQLAILGVGRARTVPAFGADGALVRREECVFSWSADHRVVDGATAARCAELVKQFLEAPEEMLVKLR